MHGRYPVSEPAAAFSEIDDADAVVCTKSSRG